MAAAEIWGRIYAVIDNATPGGLTAVSINNAAQAPGLHFAEHHNRAFRRMVKTGLLGRMTELMNMLEPDHIKDSYALIEQGNFFRGFYAERSKLPPRQGGAPGRPQKGSGQEVAWSDVNWTLSNAEIARAKGVSPQAVAAQRKRWGTISPNERR